MPDRRATPDALPNNAIRGFIDMIATLVTDHSPTDLVACWDNDWRPKFRVEAIPSYKTHRMVQGTDGVEESPDNLTPQVPVIVDVLAAVGLTRLGLDGYEADDVIGTLAVSALGTAQVDIVTGDRDLFQLVDDEQSVRVLYTAKGGVREPDVVDEAFLERKYGVASGAAYADMAVLRGDSSDGLPGVTGIGEKRAATLINRYGDLATLRAAVDSGDPELKGAQRKRLEAAGDYLDAAPRVVEVVKNITLPTDFRSSLPERIADPGTLRRLTEDHDLTSPVARLLKALRLDTFDQ
jgi:5'-3' exonuclease